MTTSRTRGRRRPPRGPRQAAEVYRASRAAQARVVDGASIAQVQGHAFHAGWVKGQQALRRGTGQAMPARAAARAARRYALAGPVVSETTRQTRRAAFLAGWAKGRGEHAWSQGPTPAGWVHVTQEGRRGLPVIGCTAADGRHIDLRFASWASVTELANTLLGIRRGAARTRGTR